MSITKGRIVGVVSALLVAVALSITLAACGGAAEESTPKISNQDQIIRISNTVVAPIWNVTVVDDHLKSSRAERLIREGQVKFSGSWFAWERFFKTSLMKSASLQRG